MPRPVSKAQLIDEARREYAALEKLLAPLSLQVMTAPGALGEWSVKDVLAHLYAWQQMFFGWYAAGLRGEIPALPAQGYNWAQLPALNQAIFERYQETPLDELLACFRQSHQATLALIESLPEAELTATGQYAWLRQHSLLTYFNANTASHYRWARSGLRKGLKARPATS